ncbi:MAG: HIRAN domain-containing protein [Candidatus Thiodiazotropha sp.]|jgi:hypothetical protein
MHPRNLLHTLLGSLGRPVYAKRASRQSRRRLMLQESPLAGFQYHRAAAIWPFLRVGEPLHLRREAGNPFDSNAVAVWFRNEHLGYIPRRENRTLARLMDQGSRLEATIVHLLDDRNPWCKIRIRVELLS